jgi:cation:H+ antiporter
MSLLGVAMACSLPAIGMRLSGFDPHSAPLLGMIVFGLGIVSAAFVLTWAAEVAEGDIGSGLAVILLALVTVLPEYAVDLLFAWKAVPIPEYRAYALANMTGANRLLIGIGWPTVALLVWYRENRKGVLLDKQRSGDVVWLGAASLYCMLIPLKGDLAWYDAVVLIAIYGLYVATTGGEGGEHPEPVGPPLAMVSWPKKRRRWATVALFVWSACAIGAASEPFADSLVLGGKRLGVDEYFLIQWLAPLASESPEFVVTILLVLRGRAAMGFGALVSSKVNQWTLLVGGVPIAYGLSGLHHGHGFQPLVVDAHQVEELWLTATQSLYAVATIVDLEFSFRQALAILVLFLVQFLGSILLEAFGRHAEIRSLHVGLSFLYAALALERFVSQRRHMVDRWRQAFGRSPRPAPAGPHPDRHDEGDV